MTYCAVVSGSTLSSLCCEQHTSASFCWKIMRGRRQCWNKRIPVGEGASVGTSVCAVNTTGAYNITESGCISEKLIKTRKTPSKRRKSGHIKSITSFNVLTNRLSVEITRIMAPFTIPVSKQMITEQWRGPPPSALNPTQPDCSSPTQADQGQ